MFPVGCFDVIWCLPLARPYDGFLQLHVEGAASKAIDVKTEAEAALLEHFKSPIYLVEKPFYKPDEEGDDGIDESLIVPPGGASA